MEVVAFVFEDAARAAVFLQVELKVPAQVDLFVAGLGLVVVL